MANALGYDLLQNGVVASGDLAQTLGASSITNGGTVTYSIAAATAAWVKDANSALIRITPAAQNSQTFAASITSTKYVVYGIEIDPNGVLSTVKGAETATQLNTGSLIASNSPATSSGKMRVMDIAIWNNAGTYNYGDHTQSGSQGVNWIDRRPWARGAYAKGRRTSDLSLVGSASVAIVDTTNLQLRIECAVANQPVRAAFRWYGNTAGGNIDTALFVDGSLKSNVEYYRASGGNVGQVQAWECTDLSAGSHLFSLAAANPNVSTVTIYGTASSAQGMTFTVEELVRQNTNNGTA